MGKVANNKSITKSTKKTTKTILVTLQKPDTDRSPYFELAQKYGVNLLFHPFIKVEGVSGKDFRKQKIEIQNYTAVIFTSRNAIDHFFRICEEMKLKISSDFKYFCITEAIALYLQKFILYRKRKVFFGENGTINGLLDVIVKHKVKEKLIIPANDVNRKEITDTLKKHQFEFVEAVLYKTVSNDVKDIMKQAIDMMLFFSPYGVKSLFDNMPAFKQKDTLLGGFGPTTNKAIEDAGLELHIKAPAPNAPSMVAALDIFLKEFTVKTKKK